VIHFLRGLLHGVARHTGLPIPVLAAALIVTAWNIARKAWRILVQFLVVLVALAVASKLGWISW
jgi:hypothetical protein